MQQQHIICKVYHQQSTVTQKHKRTCITVLKITKIAIKILMS